MSAPIRALALSPLDPDRARRSKGDARIIMSAFSVCPAQAAPRSRRRFRQSLLQAALLLAVPAALAACTSTSGLPLAPANPSPDAGVLPALPPYHIQAGDILDIKLVLNPDLNEEVTVRPDGHISTSIVPDERAYGLTVSELTKVLRHDYESDLKNPRLTVVVKSFAPTRIYVGGEVNGPGEYVTVGPNLTLSQAIARAGGVKVSGSYAKVFIIRRGPGDVPQLFSTRYNKVVYAKEATADVRLAPFDVVYVPRTGIAEVYVYFNQYIQQFVPISWGVFYTVASSTGGVTPISNGSTTVGTTAAATTTTVAH